jgi:hypothetical protein
MERCEQTIAVTHIVTLIVTWCVGLVACLIVTGGVGSFANPSDPRSIDYSMTDTVVLWLTVGQA